MKRKISILIASMMFLMLGAHSSLFAQKEKIEGLWYNQEKTAKIEIYKAKDTKFYGKIVWLQEPNRDGKPKTDIHNPNEAQRSAPELGLLILKRFSKNSDTKFDDGTIYDPRNGKTYSCTITVKDANTLSIRGYVGISLLGQTNTWTRTN
jgi:uncharacterized protein (DUF2147 family)